MPIIKPKDMPDLYKPYMQVRGKKRRLRGLFVGGCVERGDGSSFRAKAHSHTYKYDPHRGWICIRAAWRLDDQRLLIHELSHILTWQGHTEKWRAKFLELGGDPTNDGAFMRHKYRQEQKQNQL